VPVCCSAGVEGGCVSTVLNAEVLTSCRTSATELSYYFGNWVRWLVRDPRYLVV